MKYKESVFNLKVPHNDKRTLVYNTYSQAVCWFDNKTYSTFKGKTSIDPSSLEKDIIRLGFCVPEHEDEIQKILNERKRAYSNSSHLEYVIAPTLKCNMRCIYCFENLTDKCLSMNSTDAESVISYITKDFETKSPHKIHIKWFGGEPTLELDIIKQVSSKLKENAEKNNIIYFSSIITNGFLLNAEIAKRLKETCFINSVQISLDGFKNTYSKMRRVSPETFDTVVNNIVESASIININVRLNINQENMSEMNELINYLLVEKQLKNKIRINPAFIRDYNFNDVKSLYSEYEFEVKREELLSRLIESGFEESLWLPKNEKRLFFCPASRNTSITIGPDLKLYNCECLVGRKEYTVGDCINGRIPTDINSLFSKVDIPPKCQNCKLLPACGLGCTERVYVENTPVNCDAVKQALCSNVRLLLKRRALKKAEGSEQNGNYL